MWGGGFSFTVSWTTNWYSHSGNQYGEPSKRYKSISHIVQLHNSLAYAPLWGCDTNQHVAFICLQIVFSFFSSKWLTILPFVFYLPKFCWYSIFLNLILFLFPNYYNLLQLSKCQAWGGRTTKISTQFLQQLSYF